MDDAKRAGGSMRPRGYRLSSSIRKRGFEKTALREKPVDCVGKPVRDSRTSERGNSLSGLRSVEQTNWSKGSFPPHQNQPPNTTPPPPPPNTRHHTHPPATPKPNPTPPNPPPPHPPHPPPPTPPPNKPKPPNPHPHPPTHPPTPPPTHPTPPPPPRPWEVPRVPRDSEPASDAAKVTYSLKNLKPKDATDKDACDALSGQGGYCQQSNGKTPCR